MSNPIAQAGRWAALVLAMAACSKAYPPGPQPVLQDGMVKIPAGAFWMGSDDGDADEEPLRRVTLTRDYLLDEREVTAGEYAKCVDQGQCKPQFGSHESCNGGKADRAHHPMNCVDWHQAKAYCAFVGKQLPTEAQWERAARGGKEGQKYVWGNDWPPPAGAGNFWDSWLERLFAPFDGYDDDYEHTAPGCTFTRNGYGLCDMAGNVWEWVADAYDSDAYAMLPAIDPSAENQQGSASRVVRGGSWNNSSPDLLRAANRNYGAPDYHIKNVGFRCARTL